MNVRRWDSLGITLGFIYHNGLYRKIIWLGISLDNSYVSILKYFPGFLIFLKKNILILCLEVVSLTASILRIKPGKGLEISIINM